MSFGDLSNIAGAIFLSLGGGAAIVFALSKWLGGVWASRILENKRAEIANENEMLIRRRDIYTKLSVTMRVFLKSEKEPKDKKKESFLNAYDEAALWASEEVITTMGKFLDIVEKNNQIKGDPKEAFINCITAMRKDSGFPKTKYKHRPVVF